MQINKIRDKNDSNTTKNIYSEKTIQIKGRQSRYIRDNKLYIREINRIMKSDLHTILLRYSCIYT